MAVDRMDPEFLAELNERLFVHYTQGAWRAPLGHRLLNLRPVGVARWGGIICGDARDVARALAGVAAGGTADTAAMAQAWAQASAGAADIRAVEGLRERINAAPLPSDAAPRPTGSEIAPNTLTPSPDGPAILLSAADTPLDDVVALLIDQAARGVLWKPAPRAAASAHYAMRALAPAAQGRLALLQGDHQTGAELARHGPVIWASTAPPPAGMALLPTHRGA
ncbi:hypothetical protein [Pararhodobacter oceanensis]|uniref:hypothetical protein n=1 Tax=Pararhodobacter oceanensis TaxID=2172121 RepID=UPI003A91E8CA